MCQEYPASCDFDIFLVIQMQIEITIIKTFILRQIATTGYVHIHQTRHKLSQDALVCKLRVIQSAQ